MTKTQDIRDAVELELSYDPLVDISDITVKNINGEVALNGTVPRGLFKSPQFDSGSRVIPNRHQ
jgi:hypothetical protein